jgi:hypothetical protein
MPYAFCRSTVPGSPPPRAARGTPAPSPLILGRRGRPKLAAVRCLRPIACAVAAVLALTLAAGCSSFDKAFGNQQAVVQFQAETPIPVMLKVRASCSHVPAAIPERIPRHALAVQMQDDIVYQVSNASDADLARLQQCLQHFPSVVGIEFNTPDGS